MAIPDTDHANDDAKNTRNRALQARLSGSRALPGFVVVDPRSGEKQPLTRGGTLDAELFAEFLRAFPATPRHAAPR